MLKLPAASLICLLTVPLFAQDIKNPNLQSLVKTERAFAKLATDKDIKTAFLTYLADSSVTFGGGKPQNGRKQYEALQATDALLTWEPTYSEISASGDFGFNTGPWQYKVHRTDSVAVAYGDFVSVWQKQSNGNWKLYLDLGVRHPAPTSTEKSSVTTTAHPLRNPLKGTISSFKTSLVKAEMDFQQSFTANGIKAYEGNRSGDERFFRTGKSPAISKEQVNDILTDQDRTMSVNYKIIDAFVSNSGDMGCVYGTVSVTFKNGTDTNLHTACYQRIWKKVDGKNWKIAVDVIGVN